jgi:glycerophosphoryl diester phosphodiesterase
MRSLEWLTSRPIAHRGLHDAATGVIENTASAFSRAIDSNYGIECDLQITADEEAVVHHDAMLGRLTDGDGALAEMTAADLIRVPFKQTGDRIMPLGDLCDLVAGRVPLLLELKSQGGRDSRLPRRVADVLRRYSGPVAAMSFDPDQVLGLRIEAPSLVRGITAQHWTHGWGSHDSGGTWLTHLGTVLLMRPQFVAYAVKDLPSAAPLLARKWLGLPLLTWTVRTHEDRMRAARWADQMIFEGFTP